MAKGATVCLICVFLAATIYETGKCAIMNQGQILGKASYWTGLVGDLCDQVECGANWRCQMVGSTARCVCGIADGSEDCCSPQDMRTTPPRVCS